ncbi:MAG: glutamine--fructose-6-phosphate aminotransferase, partial [Aquificota bacterium]
MCGIVGYLGKEKALGVLLEGLKRLEYRGYDSAGVALVSRDRLHVVKSVGKIRDLERALKDAEPEETIHLGVGHTRWATHGRPSEANAHPHVAGPIALVHNGIIENYLELKGELEGEGYTFQSDTDSEVVAKLILYYYGGDLFEAVGRALERLKGAYA